MVKLVNLHYRKHKLHYQKKYARYAGVDAGRPCHVPSFRMPNGKQRRGRGQKGAIGRRTGTTKFLARICWQLPGKNGQYNTVLGCCVDSLSCPCSPTTFLLLFSRCCFLVQISAAVFLQELQAQIQGYAQQASSKLQNSMLFSTPHPHPSNN